MPTLPDFRLETYFSRWEFKAKYHLTASDAQTNRSPNCSRWRMTTLASVGRT